MKISNLKIGTRLGLGFGIQILLLAGAIGVGIKEVTTMNDYIDDIVNDNNVKVAAANDMQREQQKVMLATSRVVMLDNADQRAEQESRVQKARAAYDEIATVMHGKVKSDKGKEILARVDAALADTRPLVNKVRELAKAGDTKSASELFVSKAGPAAERWQAALQELVEHQVKGNHAAAQAAGAAYSEAKLMLLLIGALAVFFGTLIAWLATRSIVLPMREAVKIAQTVAAGDLNSQINSSSTDETGEMLTALKTMNDSLKDIVGQVRSGTETIASASTEIASGTIELSSRTEQQASSLEETAASMEELTTTVKQNSDNARQANMLAVSASEVAVRGGAVVSRVVETMSSINESSRRIVDIIAVIDGIAFQTNILALNAAVEAARAGEQGRGFAVVASEVRNLAQRSASAAKEIKSLIDDSVDKVAMGSTLVNNAGATMDEVVASVRRVTDIMGEISAAGREQELGIGQINQAVIEMDSVTQQNAALVEEAAAAAESLQDQAGKLMQVVSIFRLDGAVPATRSTARVALLTPRARPAGARQRSAAPAAARQVANGAPAGAADWEAF
jgi:methyl-accepting chemotaxis protein